MGALDGQRLRVVLYEGPGSIPLDPERRLKTVQVLLEAGYPVTRNANRGDVSITDDAPTLVVGQFDSGTHPDLTDDGGHLRFQDISKLDTDGLLLAVNEAREGQSADRPGEWHPWFPVIDYERCTNCMQCLSFCLFDVYSSDANGQITVRNESNCKTNCPACSRVCPEAAIVFPKYKKGPINGDVVRDQDVQSEAMKVDITALLGGDIYSALRNRSKDARKRFSTERDDSRALLERKRCLKKLKKDFDIPDEVLMSLPSAGDIQDRARRAKEKAEKRRARSRTVQDSKPPPTEQDWGI